MQVHVCECMWRTENKLGCHSSSDSSFFFLNPSLRLGDLIFGKAGWPVKPKDSPEDFPGTEVTSMCPHAQFKWMLWIKLMPKCLYGKPFTG